MSAESVARQKQSGRDGKFGELPRDEASSLNLPQLSDEADSDLDLSMIGTVHHVPESRLPEAIASIETANRRAERAGIEARFTYEVEHYTRTETAENGFQYSESWTTITLNRPALSHDDWSFVAKATWDEEAGLIVHAADGVQLEERPEKQRCDVCNKSRNRNETFIIERGGERLQVGGECVKRFFGIRPRGLWMLEFDPVSRIHDGAEALPFSPSRTDSASTMALVLSVVATKGWLSRSASEGTDRIATADVVAMLLYPGNEQTSERFAAQMREERRQIFASVDNYRDEAQEVFAFVHDPKNNDGSDYFNNLCALTSAPTVSRRHLGTFASAVALYQRAQGREAKRREHATSEWVGREGDKLENIPVKVLSTRHIDSPYGVTTLVEMSDNDGNVIKWFASGRKDFATGTEHTMKATIKKHDIYGGVKETQVTRAKLT